MGEPLNWIMRKAVEIAPKLVFQIVVSVAATLSGAAITSTFLPAKPQPQTVQSASTPSSSSVVADARTGTDLLKANFTEDGIRFRPTYPIEFAALDDFAPGALAGAGWSALQADAAAHEPAEWKPDGVKKRVLARACDDGCTKRPLAKVAATLPPPRPAALPTTVADAQPATETPPAEAKRLHLLGVPLPGFVPSGDKIAKTVVSWAGSIVDVVPGL